MTSAKPERNPDALADMIAPTHVAQMLESSLSESAADWILRLTNWRRPNRHSPFPWHPNKVGRPVYRVDDVLRFIDQTLARRATLTPPDTGPGQAKATATPDVKGGRAFVQVIWSAGAAQGSFSLHAKAAREFATKLLQAAIRSEEPQQRNTP